MLHIFCAEFSMPHIAKIVSAPKLCGVKQAWHRFTAKPTRWRGCHIKTCRKWQHFDVSSRQSHWSQCLACCFLTKSTQLIVEEEQVRWESAIIITAHISAVTISAIQEAMRSYSSRSSALNGENTLTCIISGTIIGTLEDLNQRALSKCYKIHSLEAMCSQYTCYECYNSLDKCSVKKFFF